MPTCIKMLFCTNFTVKRGGLFINLLVMSCLCLPICTLNVVNSHSTKSVGDLPQSIAMLCLELALPGCLAVWISWDYRASYKLPCNIAHFRQVMSFISRITRKFALVRDGHYLWRLHGSLLLWEMGTVLRLHGSLLLWEMGTQKACPKHFSVVDWPVSEETHWSKLNNYKIDQSWRLCDVCKLDPTQLKMPIEFDKESCNIWNGTRSRTQ